jgi:hypothetical protein
VDWAERTRNSRLFQARGPVLLRFHFSYRSLLIGDFLFVPGLSIRQSISVPGIIVPSATVHEIIALFPPKIAIIGRGRFLVLSG